MKSIDMTSRLGQFAWRQMRPSPLFLPVIFRNDNHEEYLCVQMIHIHLLSKYPSEYLSTWMKQFSIEYFPLTKAEAKLFQNINQFHSNGSLAKRNQLDYSRKDSAFITPLIPFLRFYQFITTKFQQEENPKDLSNVSKSYCRSIMFHDKEIMSYCTSSINDSNETLICFSIQDVVNIYFPWTNVDKFIHLCRLKQIIRYKPDKSTDSDLSLRLINIQQLEKYWFYFIQQLLPDDKKIKYQTKKSKLLSAENHVEEKILPDANPIEEKILPDVSPVEEKVLPDVNPVEIESLFNDLILQIEQNIKSDAFESKDEEEEDDNTNILTRIENKNLKRKRRRKSEKFSYRFKRRKRKQSIDQIQFWLNKYSIQPVSVDLQRISLPIE